MPAPTTRLFNALNGQELKKIIMQQVERALDEDFHFRQHLTYPVVSFNWNLVVSAYPLQPPEFKIGAEHDIVAAPKGEEIPMPKPEEIGTFELGGRSKIDTPNQAREESGQAVPTPIVVGRPGEQVVVERPLGQPPKKGPTERTVEAVRDKLSPRPPEE